MSDGPERDVERFIEMFERSDLTTLCIITPALELRLSRGQEAEPTARPAAPERVQQTLPSVSEQPLPVEADREPAGDVVRAPMVGIVYLSPEPGHPPFVEVGEAVAATSTVCLVEAMKVFTAVEAGTAGVLEEIYVSNGDFVEFDQALLRIAPTSTMTGA